MTKRFSDKFKGKLVSYIATVNEQLVIFIGFIEFNCMDSVVYDGWHLYEIIIFTCSAF